MERSIQKLVCVSQDMPEPTVGLANVRRFILKKSGKMFPRAHLKLRHTKSAKHFFNILEQLRPSLGGSAGWCSASSQTQGAYFCGQRFNLYVVGRRRCKKSSLAVGQNVVLNSRNIHGERQYILLTKEGKGSSIYFDRQPRRQRIYVDFDPSRHMMSKM